MSGIIDDGNREAGVRASRATGSPGGLDRAPPRLVLASAGHARDRRPSRARTTAHGPPAITGPVAMAAPTGSIGHDRATTNVPSLARALVAAAPGRRPPPPPAGSGPHAPALVARGNPVHGRGTETDGEVGLAASRT